MKKTRSAWSEEASEDSDSSKSSSGEKKQKKLKPYRPSRNQQCWRNDGDDPQGFIQYEKPFLQTPTIVEERNGVRAKLIPHPVWYKDRSKNKIDRPKQELDLPEKLIGDHSHWLVVSSTVATLARDGMVQRGATGMTPRARQKLGTLSQTLADASREMLGELKLVGMGDHVEDDDEDDLDYGIGGGGRAGAPAKHLVKAKSFGLGDGALKKTVGGGAVGSAGSSASYRGEVQYEAEEPADFSQLLQRATSLPVGQDMQRLSEKVKYTEDLRKLKPQTLIRAASAVSGGVVTDHLGETGGNKAVVRKKTAKIYFRPKKYDHRDFHKGCVNSASFLFDWHDKKIQDLRSGCFLVDVTSTAFAEVYANGGFRRLSPWPYLHLWREPRGLEDTTVDLIDLDSANQLPPDFQGAETGSNASSRRGSKASHVFGPPSRVVDSRGGAPSSTSASSPRPAASPFGAPALVSASPQTSGASLLPPVPQSPAYVPLVRAGSSSQPSVAKTTSVVSAHESATKSIGVFAQLPRLQNVRFDIVNLRKKGGTNNIEFHSREFAGWKIACENQNLGTLLNLRQGLLLDAVDPDSERRELLLMPHGRVRSEADGFSKIATGELCGWDLEAAKTLAAKQDKEKKNRKRDSDDDSDEDNSSSKKRGRNNFGARPPKPTFSERRKKAQDKHRELVTKKLALVEKSLPFLLGWSDTCAGGVEVDVEELRQPPLFKYTVRRELRILQAQRDRIAWLYLANLHAKTAGLFADPFLGRTGTSMCMDLLRSGQLAGNLLAVLDAKAIDTEHLKLEAETLVEIAQTSLGRSFANGARTCEGSVPERIEVMKTAARRREQPALAGTPALAFLAKLRIEEMTEALRTVDKEQMLQMEFNSLDWAKRSDGTNDDHLEPYYAKLPGSRHTWLHPATYDRELFRDYQRNRSSGWVAKNWRDLIVTENEEDDEEDYGISRELYSRTNALCMRAYVSTKNLYPTDAQLSPEEEERSFVVLKNFRHTLVFCPEGTQLKKNMRCKGDDEEEGADENCSKCDKNLIKQHEEYWKKHWRTVGNKEEKDGIDQDEVKRREQLGVPKFFPVYQCSQCEYMICQKCADKEHAENLARGDDPHLYRPGGFHWRHQLLALKEVGLVCHPVEDPESERFLGQEVEEVIGVTEEVTSGAGGVAFGLPGLGGQHMRWSATASGNGHDDGGSPPRRVGSNGHDAPGTEEKRGKEQRLLALTRDTATAIEHTKLLTLTRKILDSKTEPANHLLEERRAFSLAVRSRMATANSREFLLHTLRGKYLSMSCITDVEDDSNPGAGLSASVKNLLFSSAEASLCGTTLSGVLDGQCSEWISNLAEACDQEGKVITVSFPNLWLNLYEAARTIQKDLGETGGDEATTTTLRQRQAAFGYLIAHFAHMHCLGNPKARSKIQAEKPDEYLPVAMAMSNVDYLIQLLFVSLFPEHFADLKPPDLERYVSPCDGAKEFHDQSIIECILRFTDSFQRWRPRQNNLEASAEMVKGYQWQSCGNWLFGSVDEFATTGCVVDAPAIKCVDLHAELGLARASGKKSCMVAPPTNLFGAHAADNPAEVHVGRDKLVMVRNSHTSHSRTYGPQLTVRIGLEDASILNSETRVKYSIRFNHVENKTCGGGGCVSATRLCYCLSRPVCTGTGMGCVGVSDFSPFCPSPRGPPWDCRQHVHRTNSWAAQPCKRNLSLPRSTHIVAR